MTKNQIKKEFNLTVGCVSINGQIVFANDKYLEEMFEKFYEDLQDTFKVSNIKSLHITSETKVEDKFSFSLEYQVYVSTQNIHTTYHYYTHYIKTSNYIKYSLNKDSEFQYYPKSLGGEEIDE